MGTSTAVAQLVNFDTPNVRNEAMLVKGVTYEIPFTIEKAAANTDADLILVARVHSSWIVRGIDIAWDAMAGLTAVEVGLWPDQDATTAKATGEIDKDCYAASVDPHSGAALTNYAFTTRDRAKTTNKVWQDAGLAAEPDGGRWYRIGLYLTTGGTALGSIAGYVRVITPS